MKTKLLKPRSPNLNHLKIKIGKIIFILVLMILFGTAYGANYAPVIDGDFNINTTWGTASAPTATDNINYTYWGGTDIYRTLNLTSDTEISNITLKGSHLTLIFAASVPTTLTINKLTVSNEADLIIGENVTLIVNGTTSFNSGALTINGGGLIEFNSNFTSSGGGADITILSGGNIDVNATLSVTGGVTNVEIYGDVELDNLTASGGSQRINVYEGGNLSILNDATFTGSAGFEIENLGVVIVSGDLSMSGGTTGVVDGDLTVIGTLTVPNYSDPLTLTVNATGTVVAGTIVGTGLGGSGEIIEGGLLPIELAYFKAFNNNNKISFKWETASETNNDYFTIEHSEDGVNYYDMATIQGAGNSLCTLVYTAQDNNPVNGTNYYRLKQTDYNGEYSYSDVQAVNIQLYSVLEIKEVKIYPNPIASPNYILSLDLPGDYYNENAIIKVFSMSGLEIIEYEVALEGKFNTTAIDISNLTTGNYLIMVVTSSNSFKNRLVVL